MMIHITVSIRGNVFISKVLTVNECISAPMYSVFLCKNLDLKFCFCLFSAEVRLDHD